MRTILTCDCCRMRSDIKACLYDDELEEFVCKACWPELLQAREILLDAGLCQTLGVQMERRFTIPKEPNT